MKTFTLIMKILVALAAVAGAVFVVATYGDKIVAWAKNLLHTCHCKKAGACDEESAESEDEIIILRNGTIKVPAEAAEESAKAEEAPAEEAPAAEEAPEEAAPAEENAVVADDQDFEA